MTIGQRRLHHPNLAAGPQSGVRIAAAPVARRRPRPLLRGGLPVCALAFVALGCGSQLRIGDTPLSGDGSTVRDAAVGDSAVPDSAVPDSALGDAGFGDAGFGDAGFGDAGPGDAAFADAGPGDAAVGDSAVPDSAIPDSAVPDSSVVVGGWRPVPLRNQAQQTAGIDGGEGFQQIQAIQYAPSDPRRVYMAVDTSWVWRSDDGGQSWDCTTRTFPIYGATSIWVDSEDPDVVVVMALTHNFFESQSGLDNGYYRTSDGGRTWNAVFAAPLVDKWEQSGNMFAVVGSRLYGGHPGGIAVSDTRGASWSETAFSGEVKDLRADPSDAQSLLVVTLTGLVRYNVTTNAQTPLAGLPSAPNGVSVSSQPSPMIYVACDEGIYKSPNGASWVDVSPSGPTSHGEVHASPVDGDVVYCMSSGGRTNSHVFSSSNGGDSWRPFGAIDPLFVGSELLFYRSFDIATHPTEADTAIAAINGQTCIARTTDAGGTWSYSQDRFTGYPANEFIFISATEFYAVGTDRGLVSTATGGSRFDWLETGTAYSADVSGTTILTAFGDWHGQTPALSSDGGRSWTRFPQHKRYVGFSRIHDTDPQVMYQHDMRSTNGGSSWDGVTYPILAVFPANNDVVYGIRSDPGNGVYIERSINQGRNWSTISPLIPILYEGRIRQLQDVEVHPTNRDLVYIASTDGVYILDSGVVTLRDASDGLAVDSLGRNKVSRLAINPSTPRIIYAGRKAPAAGPSNGVFVSYDAGETWEQMDMTGLPQHLDIQGLDYDRFNDRVYIGSMHGLFYFEPS